MGKNVNLFVEIIFITIYNFLPAKEFINITAKEIIFGGEKIVQLFF